MFNVVSSSKPDKFNTFFQTITASATSLKTSFKHALKHDYKTGLTKILMLKLKGNKRIKLESVWSHVI